jgi:hypothetical protein
MWSAALSALSAGARALVGAVPDWLWQYVLAALAGVLVGGYGVHRYHTGSVAQVVQPHIRTEERGPPSEIPARVWKGLAVGQAKTDADVDTTEVVVPTWYSANERAGNGLPEVTYSRDLLDAALSLPELDFVTVGLKNGRRPAVEVTPDRVRLFANSPQTGRPLTYTYQVPSPSWAVGVEGALSGSLAPLSSPRLQGVAAESTIGLSRQWDDWSARLGVGVGASRERAGGVVTVSLSRELFSW